MSARFSRPSDLQAGFFLAKWFCSGPWFGKERKHMCKTISKKDKNGIYILPQTNIFAPKNGWLEAKPFLLGRPIFQGRTITGVSGSVAQRLGFDTE